MNEELDYAEMLEIPVSTVNVVKKKSIFKHKPFAPKQQSAAAPVQDELKELVVDSVNERIGAYTYAEDLSEPQKPEKKRFIGKDKASRIIFTELIAVCVLAVAIFLTNIFMPNSAINTFIGTLTGDKKADDAEPSYNELTLSPVISDFSDAVVNVSESGVLSFTSKGSVYPICAGKVSSVTKEEGANTYTVEIAHTSTFTSVVTGLTDVYAAKGTSLKANLPFAYSDGEAEVRVSMYDNGTLLNCYTLAGEVPVWKS